MHGGGSLGRYEDGAGIERSNSSVGPSHPFTFWCSRDMIELHTLFAYNFVKLRGNLATQSQII